MMLRDLGPIQKFQPGDIIYNQDEPGSGLIYLDEGRIKNSFVYSDGTEKNLNFLDAPSISGETAIIDGGTSVCSAIALTKAKVVLIPREQARQLLLNNPNLMLIFLEYMAKKIRSMQIQAREVVSNIPQRLAYILLDSGKYGIYIHKEQQSILYITHDELAGFVGTTRPKITQHLNAFMKQGLIAKGRGFIEIKDPEGLRQIAHH